jgi:hypothetical protein
MWNAPSDFDLEQLPRLYETENTPALDTLIHQHYFMFNSDWYVAEYGKEDRVFFGYTILNGDMFNSEWGYISLDELLNIRVLGIQVDRDLNWKVRRAKDIDRIMQAERVRGR